MIAPATVSAGISARRALPWMALAVVVAVLDQATKTAILGAFTLGERRPILPFFDLTLLFNTGAAFSFLAGASGWQRQLFLAIGLAASALIAWLLARPQQSRLLSVALALILGGAIGNVIDRLLHGHVVDFLLFYWGRWYWPAFNVADSSIVVGAALLVLDEALRMRRSR